MTQTITGNTREQIMDNAYRLMQVRGYHAFSYADIAAQLGIRKASIHYYFPQKSDLVREVVTHYRMAAISIQTQVQNETDDPAAQLLRYADLVGAELDGQPRLCICGYLAAELLTLPDDVRVETQMFYAEQIVWLSAVIRRGVDQGVLHIPGAVADAAQLALAAVEGAMLTARAYGSTELYRSIVRQLVASYQVNRELREGNL